MVFIYKITEVKFCILLRKYRDVTLAANEASAYTMLATPQKAYYDSYATQIFTN